MKRPFSLSCLAIAMGVCSFSAFAADTQQPTPVPTAEPFESTILTTDLAFPWDMVWGPDNYLWVTERQGKRITRVNPTTGEKQVVATLDKVHVGPQHEGVLGLALAPDFLKDGSSNYLYTSYTYMDGKDEHTRIVRLQYDPQTQTVKDGSETTLIEGLPAGDDHNAGRLRFGPDDKLYYTIGEQGHNQGVNFCKHIEAQRLPTAAELAKHDYVSYAGKSLRLNTDGTVPADNPVINGVKSHVFTYGHRNPQGLVFINGVPFSSEQGPSSDDEINILVAGGNYGWPHVAGFQDDQGYVYANYSAAKNCPSLKFDANYIPKGVPIQKESDWKTPANFQPPIKTFYTVRSGYNFADKKCGDLSYLCWATIAPSSITYYPKDGKIKAWSNSLLITSLKNGALYRVPLDADMKGVQGDESKYFHSANRYRVSVVDPDTSKIYIATDTAGNVLDENGNPTQKVSNPGSILVFEYKGN
ncbi:MAG: PQQ-dependent sugar dehydrogenase [Enterobacteriaceae bacterium]|jgi:PQQ-dependent dehydrogenase (s-GDH family)|nr:PQQ-dependent sugar dehydrogenase [Enterobacteriaceae bacterium]